MEPGGFALLVGPGCLMRLWAAARRPSGVLLLVAHGCSGRRRARPPARLGPHFVRRRASKPARALRSLRRPPHQWGWVAVVWFGALFWCLSGPCRCPRVSHPGPVDQTARLSETAVACARECLRGLETAIAFAGENWVLLARFSVALVLSVSMGVVQGRALVMVVSRRTVSVVVEVSLVSPSPPHCVLCAKNFALRALVVGVSAKKFALRAQNGPKSAFYGVLGELFRGSGREGMLLGELCRACEPATATSPGPPLPAGLTARPCGVSSTLHIGDGGGFAALGAGCRRVAGVSHP